VLTESEGSLVAVGRSDEMRISTVVPARAQMIRRNECVFINRDDVGDA